MVFVGVREYTSGIYPAQGPFLDDFKFNVLNYDFSPTLPDANLLETTFVVAALITPHYYNAHPDEVGHQFCGFYELSVTAALTYEDPYGFELVSFLYDNTDFSIGLIN